MRVNRVLKIAVAYTLAAASSMALAQAPESSTVTELETVIVTGSYIKGTAEDASLPVDVVTTEDLQKQGSPNMTDLVKAIPAMQGIIGESNQFGVSQAAGTSNVNLRGLGAARTLVLLNGKRLATSPAFGVVTDTNLLPVAAIGRIEVLKDGAAATYGSDAVAGVVNFITKERFEGLSLDGSYTYIDGSDGEYDAKVAWGWQGDLGSALVAANYRHRSALSTLERDWALRPRAESAEGGWTTFSNPGSFFTYNAAGTAANGAFNDPACASLGGTPVPGCTFQYTAFDNLVEDEDHYNVYGEYNLALSDAFNLHAEALWAMHDVPNEHVSPSYGPGQGPASAASGGASAPTFFIPYVAGNPAASNPGLTALYPYLTVPQQGLIDGSRSGTASPGIGVSGLQWRPFAQGGNPITGGAQENARKFEGFRVALGANGEFGETMSYDVGVTYAGNGNEISTPDILVSRLQLALRGLGGPDCVGTTPGQNGCLWLNPFSTAIPVNAATGQVNTVTPASVPNDPALAAWITTPNSIEDTTTMLAVEAVLNGELPILALPGGNIGWAAGAQYRENTYERVVTDPYANGLLTPCAASPVNPAATCTIPANGAAPQGALSFYAPYMPVENDQDVVAGFAEFNLPILDSLSAQLAVRHEDYGGAVGATTNPKLSVRYQPIDALTFRGSYGSTFRAPPQNSLSGSTTFLFYTPQVGGFKPVDTAGNPNLQPETADTFNVGVIVKAAGFTGSVDYWNFVLKDALSAEVGTQLITAMYTPWTDENGNSFLNRCNTSFIDRFDFAGAGSKAANCATASNLLRTRANNINAQTETEISGLDISLAYLFDLPGGSELLLGADGTYNLEYALGDNYVDGILIDPASDAVGTRGGRAGSQPQWKGAAFVNYEIGDHNVRLTARYVSSMEEKYRTATFNTPPTPAGSPANRNGYIVDSWLTFDFSYNVMLPANISLSASVINLTDEDPSFARLDLNYDPFVGNPLGRYFKLGAGVKF
jgi:iron complex outermembrane receptor protein